jgi:hypothetical protein
MSLQFSHGHNQMAFPVNVPIFVRLLVIVIAVPEKPHDISLCQTDRNML